MGWQREERVLLCTPLRDASPHLPMFFSHLRNFTYPHHLIDLAFLVSDSKDDTLPQLVRMLEELQADPDPKMPFGEVSVIEKDFGQTVEQDFESRHGFAAQAGRRKLMAQKEKKEKKEKQPKPAAAPAAPPSPSLIDLRVGHILRAIRHPNADSLYVSTIDCGDAPGSDNTSVDEATGKTVRTVCSGLNGLVPLEEMQGRKVVVVCNLKPVTMRGIKSAAMVLAASPRVAEGVSGCPKPSTFSCLSNACRNIFSASTNWSRRIRTKPRLLVVSRVCWCSGPSAFSVPSSARLNISSASSYLS
ncbi:hypothetical protein VTN31DRAFT_6385 [Thermomyces dupontii]|uniref:uncharacterized protein n=1 Tax=Talaromyces thermophilus TaxID=28565 RepID=UPI0037422DB7